MAAVYFAQSAEQDALRNNKNKQQKQTTRTRGGIIMNGHKFLKVTGILMIIAAVFSIIAGVLVGGLGALAA